MIEKPDSFWLQRWYSLRNSIIATKEDAKKHANTDKTLKRFELLLERLLEFGAEQFYYFYLGFEGNPPRPEDISEDDEREYDNCQRLVRDYTYPPEHVLRVVLDQIAYDYEVIQRALHQRISSKDDLAEQQTLESADKLGKFLLAKVAAKDEEAMANEEPEFLVSMPEVISYFNRSPRIRMIPYANVALIGIPMTAMIKGKQRDLLIIPHELGHYIYWHGRIEGKPVREVLRDMVQGEMPYVKSWIEEIFADVFGLILGEVSGMAIWAFGMIRDNPTNLYIQDNYTHPIDAVRPYIFLDTLKYIEALLNLTNGISRQDILAQMLANIRNPTGNNQVDPTILEQLENMIETWHIAAGGHDSFSTINRQGEPVDVKLETVRDTLIRIVVRIGLNIIMPVYGPSDWGWREVLAELGETVRDNMSQGVHDPTPLPPVARELQVIGNNQSLMNLLAARTELDNAVDVLLDKIATITGEVKPQLDLSSEPSFVQLRKTRFAGKLEPDIWKIVFAADGWTVKGPETWPTRDWERSWEESSFHL